MTDNPREYFMSERLFKQRISMGKEMTCLVCREPIKVGDIVKAGYGYRGTRRGKLRHSHCLGTETK